MGNLIAKGVNRVKRIVLRPQREPTNFLSYRPFLNHFHGLGREFNNLALSRECCEESGAVLTCHQAVGLGPDPDLLNDGPLVIAPFDLRNGTLSA